MKDAVTESAEGSGLGRVASFYMIQFESCPSTLWQTYLNLGLHILRGIGRSRESALYW